MITRLFDFTLSALALLLLFPFLFLLALIVKCSSPGPVFYHARRVGKNGTLFYLYKFRTMFVGADRKGPGITLASDKRITAIGRILRRTKLDELPQLINVIKGDMALVGPRPEDPRYVAHYNEQQKKILSVRPGVTSLASLRFRNEQELLVGENWQQVYLEQIMPQKLQIDLEYLQKRNLRTDIKILVSTALIILHRT